jgi:CMP-N-acetylneuraminic acid synthetase
MKTIAIIPARGGSKAIPRKNIKKLCGKPLISYIIKTALKVKDIDRVIVSTEDEEIANIAKEYGAEIPFMRPEELAKDETPTLPVLEHTIKFLIGEENYKPDIIILLYSTTPLLSSEKISEALKIIKEKGYDSVISVTDDRGHYWIEKEDNYERFYPKIVKNRQLVNPLFKENGAIYIFKSWLLLEKNEIVGGKVGLLEMEKDESIEIDEPFDFEIVEYLMMKKNR